MSVKITLIGAGSVVFAKALIGDVLQFPELSDAQICLMDIDPARLQVAQVMTQKIIAKLGVKATVSATTSRRDAVKDANYVICTIQVGGYKPGTVIDFEIPKKYGLQQTIGDTLGVGGVFRGLRTIPEIIAIAQDIAEVGASGALFLNYSNPMAMNCWAIDRAVGVPHVGLCHSVQGTSAQLANFAGLPLEDVNYIVAGINHMAFFLKFEYRGQDAYPLLFKALEDPERRAELVRFEMMRRLGYFVTESSEHQSEYVPYFIHHGNEIIDRYNIPIDEYLRRCETIIATWERSEQDLLGKDGDINVPPQGHEYGSYIIHSCETNIDRVIYGNVPNRNLITNLPEGCCVEVPCLVNRNGIQPTYIGDLPPQLAAICRTNINVQALTVEAALTKNREAIYHAVMLDPHAAATLPLDKIWNMCDDLIEAHQKVGLLGEFKPTIPNTGRTAKGITDRVIVRLNTTAMLAQECNLTITVENPNASDFAADISLQSSGTALESPHSISMRAKAGETVTMPVSIRFVTEPGHSEKITLSASEPNILLIGANLERRSILQIEEEKPATFEYTLAGFSAVKGSVTYNDEGITVQAKVLDSKVPARENPSPWSDSRIELKFASVQGERICTFFFLPSTATEISYIFDADSRTFLTDGIIKAKTVITPIDYEIEAFLPWEAVKLSKGDFLFDSRANLLALGDAHSGGYCALNSTSGGPYSSAHFSFVTKSS